MWRTSSYTPGQMVIAATKASTLAASRPSEKFGTHSISRFIVLAFCPVVPANYLAVSAFCPAAWAVRTRTLAYSDCLVPPGLGHPDLALARASLILLLA